MPIASHKVDAPVDIKQNLPRIEEPRAQTIVTDDRETPLRTLTAFLEGAPWSVDLIMQIVAKDNDLREVDAGEPDVYQQYQRVKGFELRVVTPLASSYDNSQGITSVTGTAIINPSVTVNVNDYFVAEADIDQLALFRITELERKTFNRQAAFAADYTLVGYIKNIPDIWNTINDKVIREYVFDKTRMIENLQPLVKTDVYDTVTNLRNMYRQIVHYYFRTFYNRNASTLVLPGQDYMIYDSFLVNYLLKIVDTFDAPEIRNVRQLPVDNEPYLSQPTFWDALLASDYDMLGYVNTKMGIVSKLLFDQNTWLPGFRYSSVDYIVYPENPDTTTNTSADFGFKLLSSNEIIKTQASNNGIGKALVNTYTDATGVYQIYHDIVDSGMYVMSPAFYNDQIGKSVIELLTRDYMKGLTVSLDKLKIIVDNFDRLTRLEQFYFGPIILTLILKAQRTHY